VVHLLKREYVERAAMGQRHYCLSPLLTVKGVSLPVILGTGFPTINGLHNIGINEVPLFPLPLKFTSHLHISIS
jgi:hypothetical protein